jgi:hypothetical protein
MSPLLGFLLAALSLLSGVRSFVLNRGLSQEERGYHKTLVLTKYELHDFSHQDHPHQRALLRQHDSNGFKYTVEAPQGRRVVLDLEQDRQIFSPTLQHIRLVDYLTGTEESRPIPTCHYRDKNSPRTVVSLCNGKLHASVHLPGEDAFRVEPTGADGLHLVYRRLDEVEPEHPGRCGVEEADQMKPQRLRQNKGDRRLAASSQANQYIHLGVIVDYSKYLKAVELYGAANAVDEATDEAINIINVAASLWWNGLPHPTGIYTFQLQISELVVHTATRPFDAVWLYKATEANAGDPYPLTGADLGLYDPNDLNGPEVSYSDLLADFQIWQSTEYGSSAPFDVVTLLTHLDFYSSVIGYVYFV